MLYLRFLLPVSVALAAVVWCRPLAARADADATDRAKKFVAAHEAKLRPLEIAANRAWWDANISGKDEDFQKKEEAQNRVDQALADHKAFQQVKDLQDHPKDINDKLNARCFEALNLTYLEKQTD